MEELSDCDFLELVRKELVRRTEGELFFVDDAREYERQLFALRLVSDGFNLF